ncbi:mechanosensitive ion channel family protein [Geitlerinema sp. P-1104]|nr:mechanosensitive ion channel family protein [Geitlerinema sp. P-1104]NMG60249.1 mechanosensitive ion channel family protein [Geitlerinema sp. P-1104]
MKIRHNLWQGIGSYRFTVVIFATGFLFFASPHQSVAQDEMIPMPASENSTLRSNPDGDVYFADILVRGRPIFQVGSLADLGARERAKIINRRISSLLAQSESETLGQVTVKPDNPRQVATLRSNNRVLMTVTQQDAQDFGLSVEALAERWAEQLDQAIEKTPLAIDVGQRLYGTVQQLLRNTVANLPSLLGALVMIGITWGIAKVVRFIGFSWAQRTEGDRGTEILIGRLGYGGVWVLGSVVTLGVLGLDFGALLGALGLTSVAIGFSLKDVLSNYISGVILLAARPFGINDQVVISEYEGTITQINLRATTMKTYDGRLVYIPNQEVFSASIINNTASPRRRSSIRVGIDYNADISHVKQVIETTLSTLSGLEKVPPPEILVLELAASTVNLEVRFWVDSRRLGFLTMTSQVSQSIKEALQQANIEMPTDIYTLMFRNSLLPTDTTGNSQSHQPPEG